MHAGRRSAESVARSRPLGAEAQALTDAAQAAQAFLARTARGRPAARSPRASGAGRTGSPRRAVAPPQDLRALAYEMHIQDSLGGRGPSGTRWAESTALSAAGGCAGGGVGGLPALGGHPRRSRAGGLGAHVRAPPGPPLSAPTALTPGAEAPRGPPPRREPARRGTG